MNGAISSVNIKRDDVIDDIRREERETTEHLNTVREKLNEAKEWMNATRTSILLDIRNAHTSSDEAAATIQREKDDAKEELNATRASILLDIRNAHTASDEAAATIQREKDEALDQITKCKNDALLEMTVAISQNITHDTNAQGSRDNGTTTHATATNNVQSTQETDQSPNPRVTNPYLRPPSQPNHEIFMGRNIDIGSGRHPILTPHQFQMDGQAVMEVESHKFQKATISVKCDGPDTIFTFYNTFRHVVASYNIMLLPLEDIMRQTGTCLLTPNNCLGYDNIKDTMSTAIFLKLTSNDYFKNFPQAIAYVNAASATSNVFQLIYRIVELVHPKLRQEKGGIHKIIPAPTYTDVTDDSIYTFLTKYKTISCMKN